MELGWVIGRLVGAVLEPRRTEEALS
jgi:hypothetical protein